MTKKVKKANRKKVVKDKPVVEVKITESSEEPFHLILRKNQVDFEICINSAMARRTRDALQTALKQFDSLVEVKEHLNDIANNAKDILQAVDNCKLDEADDILEEIGCHLEDMDHSFEEAQSVL